MSETMGFVDPDVSSGHLSPTKDFKHGQLTHNLLYELNTNQKMIG